VADDVTRRPDPLAALAAGAEALARGADLDEALETLVGAAAAAVGATSAAISLQDPIGPMPARLHGRARRRPPAISWRLSRRPTTR
jgi:hypothetical protein